MPAKSTKTTKPKVTRSNVAKSSSKTGLLSKKIKFNWKIAIIVTIVLVAALGYLIVRLSKAAAYTWNAPNINIEQGVGSRTTKQGRQAIQSVKFSNFDRQDSMQLSVNSSVNQSDTYCFQGYSLNGLAVNIGWQVGITNTIPVVNKLVAKGDFNECVTVPPAAQTGSPRKITFQGAVLNTDNYGTIWVYTATRNGGAVSGKQ